MCRAGARRLDSIRNLPGILDEFEEKLRVKFHYLPDKARSVIEEIEKFSSEVIIPGTLTGVVSDEDDHKVLECAVAGEATHIVSGDRRHLLPLREYQGIRILAATEFLNSEAVITEPTDVRGPD